MSAQRALSIPKRDADCPLEYLRALPNKTPEQLKRLELYRNYPHITPDCVEMIILLEAQQRTPIEDRKLNLLYRQYTPSRAMQIAEHEFKSYKSDENDAELENLYLQVICKLPYQEPPEGFAEILAKGSIIAMNARCEEHQASRFTCGLQVSQPSVAESINPSSASAFDAAFFARVDQIATLRTKKHIDFMLKELIEHYLNTNRVPVALRNTDSMKSYFELTTKSLRLGILRFFVDVRAPEFNSVSLKNLLTILREQISERKFTLNDKEKIADLHSYINELRISENNVLRI